MGPSGGLREPRRNFRGLSRALQGSQRSPEVGAPGANFGAPGALGADLGSLDATGANAGTMRAPPAIPPSKKNIVGSEGLGFWEEPPKTQRAETPKANFRDAKNMVLKVLHLAHLCKTLDLLQLIAGNGIEPLRAVFVPNLTNRDDPQH